jgi:hypothetical protein
MNPCDREHDVTRRYGELLARVEARRPSWVGCTARLAVEAPGLWQRIKRREALLDFAARRYVTGAVEGDREVVAALASLEAAWGEAVDHLEVAA